MTRRLSAATTAAGLALVLMIAGSAVAAPGDTTADGVVGKEDFTTRECNYGVLGAESMCKPMSVAVDPSSGRLYAVEWGENQRVLSWPSATDFENGEPADLVLGQPTFTDQGCNTNQLGRKTLCRPSGVAVDREGNVYVADRFNNRVVQYDSPATTDRRADRVFGQTGFKTDACNAEGRSESSLCFPRNVTVDRQGTLYIADTGNDRVLGYRDPLTSDTSADIVFGQEKFWAHRCGIGRNRMCEPRGLATDANGTLYVADSENHRVLAYLNPSLGDTSADWVLGQPDFRTAICNYFQKMTRNLCLPRDVGVDAMSNVYVADPKNHRVLGYFNPIVFGDAADVILGQPSPQDSSCNTGGVSASSLCEPRGVTVDGPGNVYVADTQNSRVLRFDKPLE